MRSMFAACLARIAGWWNVGRTATISSSRSVTAASAAAVLPRVERRRVDRP